MHRATRKPRAPALHSHGSSDLSGTWFSHLLKETIVTVAPLESSFYHNRVECRSEWGAMSDHETLLEWHNCPPHA